MARRSPLLTVGDVIVRSAEWLRARGVDSPRLDAELLLARILNCSRLQLYLDWQKPLTEFELSGYREDIRRRGTDRIPVARLMGKKEFYGRDFEVTPEVFVPRPETEGLVDRVLEALEAEPALQVDRPTVFEIGTGSGCIIVTLAAENGNPRYHATDISEGALAIAKRNAEKHKVASRVSLRHGPVFAGYEGSIHLIASNPPYIRADEIAELPPEVRVYDPMAALDGGADGLDVVREIARGALSLLVPGGVIWLELGEDQAESAPALFRETDGFSDVRMEEDLAGQPRYLFARRRKE